MKTSSSAHRTRSEAPAIPPATRGALGIFALIVAAGPLLYGAVDQWVQVIMVGLLAIGVLLLPPSTVPLSKWGNRLLLAIIAILVVKELAPAGWFGETLWRKDLVDKYGVELPATHHPEPARVIDGWLAAAVGAVWFLWVRRLAADRSNRAFLAWSLFGAAVLVALVSFITKGWSTTAIYGIRPTIGWRGFGPFPNRNHTADLLAMGAVIGCGCVAWAAVRKKWAILAGGICALGLVLIALLTTESRGGLIAFGLGLFVYLTLIQLRVRNRKALGAAIAVALVIGALGLAFGAPVLARFQSAEAGAVSTNMRLKVWHDTVAMWKDAPLLGHGLNSFTQIFPFYQTFELEHGIVLHPESSWRQWLVELGLLPVALGTLALGLFMSDHIREAFQGRSFFFRAAAFSAAIALLGHCVIDVPAHRWGTAGFALAALALACPMRLEQEGVYASRKTVLVPLVAGLFWLMPILFHGPPWSPHTLNRTLAANSKPPGVPIEEMQKLIGYFPLSYELNQSLGMRELWVEGRLAPSKWQRHFNIASELLPGSWKLPATQAVAVAQISPGLALSYWQQAVERAGAQRGNVFRDAVQSTSKSPIAVAAWGNYAEQNPHLLLIYAQMLPKEQARHYFDRWWQERALTADLEPKEVEMFYANAANWSNRTQFNEWMRRRAEWRPRDHREWARLLLGWGDGEQAWRLLAAATPEQDFPQLPANTPREPLESKWRIAPTNLVNAQQLATVRFRAGEIESCEEIILAVGTRADDPPWWFVQKAAFALARRGQYTDAATLLLKVMPPTARP